MGMKVGTAPVSWGVWFPDDPRQPPWKQFLDEALDAGYDAIELGPYGYLPTDRQVLRTELETRGLQLTGSFFIGAFEEPNAWSNLRSEVAAICELLKEFGAEYLVLIDEFHTDLFSGETIRPDVLGDAERGQMIETVHLIGEFAKALGITTVFHPHALTPVEFESQVEWFLDDTEADLVSLCLDVGHYAYRNGDALALFRRHIDRIPYLHLKNVDQGIVDRTEQEGITFAEAVAMGVFTDLDRGAVDFAALGRLLDEVGFDGWGIVEQDMYPVEFDKPLPIARHNRKYLRKTGLG